MPRRSCELRRGRASERNRPDLANLRAACLFILSAIALNAALCGALSGPKLWTDAYNALTGLFKEQGIQWQ